MKKTITFIRVEEDSKLGQWASISSSEKLQQRFWNERCFAIRNLQRPCGSFAPNMWQGFALPILYDDYFNSFRMPCERLQVGSWKSFIYMLPQLGFRCYSQLHSLFRLPVDDGEKDDEFLLCNIFNTSPAGFSITKFMAACIIKSVHAFACTERIQLCYLHINASETTDIIYH